MIAEANSRTEEEEEIAGGIWKTRRETVPCS